MDNLTTLITPSKVKGEVTAPSSKSMMQRAVAACFLSDLTNPEQHRSDCKILNPSDCDDAVASLRIVKALQDGANIIDCGESGLSFRMFAPIVALFDKEITMIGHGSLLKRPIGMIEAPLKSMGVECKTNDGLLPVTIKGSIKPGMIHIDASLTSQLLTGLLMALPCCEGDSEIIVDNLKSKPYVDMTLNLLNDFGINILNYDYHIFKIKGWQKYKPVTYSVEGDWSAGAFLLVAGAIAGKVKVNNLDYDSSLQADREIIHALKLCGAEVTIGDKFVEVNKNKLKAFDLDLEDCPDLFPPLVALATYCKGKTTLYGVERLKHKESNRAQVLHDEFTKLGADIKIIQNRMEILGSADGLIGGAIDSHDDHRIAMACAVAALGSKKGVQINGAKCVSKSYPDFFNDLTGIMGEKR